MMAWNFSNDKPIFQQLVDIITLEIICGNYPPGQKLEAVREFAVTAGVNPNTMQRALAETENTGIIITKRGDGRYVTEDTDKIAAIRAEYVEKKAEIFINSLKSLGLNDDEITNAVKTVLKQGG